MFAVGIYINNIYILKFQSS